MAKIPWQKIKELVLAQAGQVWDDEEKEMRRIIDAAKEEDNARFVRFPVIEEDLAVLVPQGEVGREIDRYAAPRQRNRHGFGGKQVTAGSTRRKQDERRFGRALRIASTIGLQRSP